MLGLFTKQAGPTDDSAASQLMRRVMCLSVLCAGKQIENTLQALTALAQQDSGTPGGLANLAYVEFDVHVSQ